MAEQPPLSRIHVVGYSANDRDFPILNLVLDPRVAGYQVPKDLSACPDKRYPNHVFTGAQPISGDQRVRHVWEILPSPYVPFTRYDDDLGPVQGRRRSVKNEGQVASLNSETRTTYEAREGSAIVYTELEETWSIKTDEDGNSLFPIRDRDFYDPSRGPVQERRQLFVPTGEEEGSLENINGVITQTSYEPYNEFLSVKVVQTYKVDGPQLIGKATDNEGQLTTITTQRKAAEGYVPTSPTATRTIEVSREDAESLVERIVDTPQVFGAEIYRKTREDLTPQKFKAAQEDSTVEENVEGTADPSITLAIGEFAKSEQQVSKFIKRVSLTSRSTTVNPDPLVEKVLTNEGQIGTRTLTLAAGPQSFEPSATLIDANVEALGDGRTVKSETVVETIFDGRSLSASKPDVIPEQFRASRPAETIQETIVQDSATMPALGANDIEKTEQRVTEFTVRKTTTSRDNATLPKLKGQDYEPSVNIVVPFEESVVASQTKLGSPATIVDPLSADFDLVREFDLEAIEAELGSINLQFPTRTSLSLPPVLKKITVVWSDSKEDGSYSSTGSGATSGVGSLSISESGSATASASVRPDFQMDMEQVYANNIPTTSHIFFLKYPVTLNDILNKIGGGVQQWPVLKPESHTLVASGASKSVKVNASGSFSYTRSEPRKDGTSSSSVSESKGDGEGFSVQNIISVATIPPCLHGNVTIDELGTKKVKGTATITFSWGGTGVAPSNTKFVDIEGKKPSNLSPTSPDNIPRNGKYLIDSRVELYQYGFARVYAEVLDATLFA
jgi:hypothetical protein